MKPARIWTFIAVTVIGLTFGRAPLHAQSVNDSDTIATEDDTKPWSQGVPLANRQAARDLFLEGNRLFKLPLFAQAAEQYLAALGQWKHPAFYFNLALAQRNLGQDVEARDSFEQALKHGEEPLGDKRFQEAQKQLADLQQKLGRIRVTCQTEGAEVTLDGVSLFTGPGNYEGWVKAKRHEITAKRPDYLSEAQRLTISQGESKTFDIRLITLSEAEASSRRWKTWKPWMVIAAGGGVAASAGVLNAISTKTFHNYDTGFGELACAKSGGCKKAGITANLNTQLSHATLERRLALGGYIVGGSLAAAGAALLYINRPHLAERQAMSSLTRSVAVIPTISSNALGVLLTMTH